jgi:heme/copper-type cytochrome/quinol oxidase subunit 2
MGQNSQQENEGSLGSVALSAMGWVELSVSVGLFILQVYLAAIAFAVAGIFISMVANFARRSQPHNPDQAHRRNRKTIRTLIIVLGWGLIGAAIVFVVVLQQYLSAFVFVLWAALLALLTGRLRA